MQFDPLGFSIITLEVFALILFILFVYPRKLRDNTLNLVKHGILSSVASAVNLVAVFVVMIPVFWKVATFDFVASFKFPIMWTHVSMGIVTISLTLSLVLLWLKEPISDLGCSKAWRLMKPIVAMWGLTVIFGAVIHLYGLR